MEVPAGEHRILLQLEAEAPERVGLAVSVVSCLIACVLGIVSFGAPGWRRLAR